MNLLTSYFSSGRAALTKLSYLPSLLHLLKAKGTVTSRAAFNRSPQKVLGAIFTLVKGTWVKG